MVDGKPVDLEFADHVEFVAVKKAGDATVPGGELVEIESVQFGDTILPGALLDWLIAATISDTDPGSGPANRVSLPETIRAVHLEPERAVVVIN